MGLEGVAEVAEQLSNAIQLHARLASEGATVLQALQEKLAELNLKLSPIHDRATALTLAEQNITAARAATDELLQHLDTTRKVEPVLRFGPGRGGSVTGDAGAGSDPAGSQLARFLGALEALEGALEFLDEHAVQLAGVQAAATAARALHDRALRDCEAEFASALATHGPAALPSAAWLAERAAPERLEASLAAPGVELLPPAAAARVAALAGAMLRGGHIACMDTYTQARGRSLDMLLGVVGFEAASFGGLGPALGGGGLAGPESMSRALSAWGGQLRAALLGCAAERALAAAVWPAPYDEAAFAEVAGRALRGVLQVGRAVCEGRGARSADRLFALLQMHAELMAAMPAAHALLGPHQRCAALLDEAHVLGVAAGRAARQLWAEFEEGVGGRGPSVSPAADAAAKLTMLDGTVHPLCATTLSFLKRLFTFPNALPLLFAPDPSAGGAEPGAQAAAAAAAAASSSIMRCLMRLLEALEAKARAYKAPALGSLFLMNNVHYMVWTVEQAAAADKARRAAAKQQPTSTSSPPAAKPRRGAKAAGAAAALDAAGAAAVDAGAVGGEGPSGLGVLGSAWLEAHKDMVEHYGAAYQQASWQPIIAALEAVLVTEEDPEPADPGRFKAWLKSRFARLNTQLDGLLKQQAGWTVPDAKLKAAVRNVIKQDLLPLYGQFWERYTAVEFTSHPDKYLRYPPGQLEHIIDSALFEGRAAAPRASFVSGTASLATMSLGGLSSGLFGQGSGPSTARGGGSASAAAGAASPPKRPPSSLAPSSGRR